ncbi:hypothetical protein P3T73_15700 [Kiritimatiellota bacterium B12222]|nr:hypothetical protein P3T73_15700 [Kiritimatiellota bacterium B12222]
MKILLEDIWLSEHLSFLPYCCGDDVWDYLFPNFGVNDVGWWKSFLSCAGVVKSSPVIDFKFMVMKTLNYFTENQNKCLRFLSENYNVSDDNEACIILNSIIKDLVLLGKTNFIGQVIFWSGAYNCDPKKLISRKKEEIYNEHNLLPHEQELISYTNSHLSILKKRNIL